MLTRNQIKSMNKPIIAVGYCELQSILDYSHKIGFNAGVYGWNYDVYMYHDAIIITGYSPFGKLVAHDICKYYDDMGGEIVPNTLHCDYDTIPHSKEQIVNCFIEKALTL